jgi:hypothetical protein
MSEREERLRQMIGYEPDTGRLYWKVKPNRNILAGRTIGRPNSWAHICFGFMGRTWMSHRVAWFLYFGYWPEHQIDHINGDPADNRIENLRDVPQTMNMQNKRRAHKNNESGLLGVSKSERGRTKPWKATIKVDGKSRTLGRFATAEEAHQAYMQAKRQFHAGAVND